MNFESVDAALDFAIENEEKARDFYTGLANRMEKEYMKQIFLDFAGEEEGHKKKLLAVKSGNLLMSAKKKVTDLKIGDYLSEVELDANLDYQQALILAMKAEKRAFKLYTDLAASTDDPGLQETFRALAQEEAKHKLRFEVEYDDEILKEN